MCHNDRHGRIAVCARTSSRSASFSKARGYAILTTRDRVVQTAVKLVIEPIFEADLDERAYSYHSGRSGAKAIKEVHLLHAASQTAGRGGNFAKK